VSERWCMGISCCAIARHTKRRPWSVYMAIGASLPLRYSGHEMDESDPYASGVCR